MRKSVTGVKLKLNEKISYRSQIQTLSPTSYTYLTVTAHATSYTYLIVAAHVTSYTYLIVTAHVSKNFALFRTIFNYFVGIKINLHNVLR